MGTVVTMPAPRRRRSTTAQKADKATILLFLGVRYVRELDGTEHEAAQARVSERQDTANLTTCVIA